MIPVTFRPLPIWPHPPTPAANRRSVWTFKAGWDNTLNLLDRELRHLGAREAVLGVALEEHHIRIDGWPRASAPIGLAHPGVEITFSAPDRTVPVSTATRRIQLTYATDACEHWQHNVRSIALGLEALRAVDRHGITRRGEQYAGFRALTAGGPSAERGRELIRKHGDVRRALMATHPDHGGDPDDFADVQAAR